MLIIFIGLAVLISWGFKEKQLNFAAMPYIIMAFYALSLLPTLTIPYLIDDMDVIYTLRTAQTPQQEIAWIFTPHNEHVIPVVKALLALSVKFLGMYTPLIHVVIIASCAAIIIIFYKLLNKLTGSAYTALLGTALLASTNLPDFASYMYIEANLFFCLYLFLILFYAQVQFFTTRQKRWLVLAFLSAVINPSTFNLGLTSIAFVFIFEYLCVAKNNWKAKMPLLLTVLAGWVLSLLPYIYAFKKVVHANHYGDIGKTSSWEVARFLEAIPVLISYLANDLVPNLLPHAYLSMGVFFLVIVALVQYRKHIDYEKVIFFALFGLGLTYIIYVFRLSWGVQALDRARYDILPTAMLCAIYAFICHPYIKEKTATLQNDNRVAAGCLLAVLLLVSVSAGTRYARANLAAEDTLATVQRFNVTFHQAFLNYVHDTGPVGVIKIKDRILGAPVVPSFRTRKYHTLMSVWRYSGRPTSFFVTLLLPKEIAQRVTMTDTTDTMFLKYLNVHKDKYGILIPLFE